MNTLFGIMTIVFIVISAVMILVILVQRPQGGGLAGAFGGSGGGGTETVFGGRVGDALTVATVITFIVWLGLAVGLNLVESSNAAAPTATPAAVTSDPNAPATDADTGMQQRTLPSGELQQGTRLPPDAQQIPADQVPEEIRKQMEGAMIPGGTPDSAAGNSSDSSNDGSQSSNPGAE